MKFVSKYFEELTTRELYEILKARAEIFVVEQECIYQDMDDIDYNSLHMFYEANGKVVAYARAYEKTGEGQAVRLGRVLTLEHGKGLGGTLLKASIGEIRKRWNPTKIVIEAQCYATGYYEREGFKICSDEFLEDGIPHVKMELVL